MLETASKMIKHLKKEQAQQAEKGGEKGGNGNCPCAGTVGRQAEAKVGQFQMSSSNSCDC